MKVEKTLMIKKDINQYDIGNIVDVAVEFVIGKDDNGNIYYRPYFMDDGIRYGVILYVVDGIRFDPDDNILELYDKEEELSSVVDAFLSESTVADEITMYVRDIVDFRKKQYTSISDTLADELRTLMHKEEILNDMLTEAARVQKKVLEQQALENARNEEIMSHLSQDEILAMQKKLASGEYNMKELADNVVAKYVDSELHRMKQDEVAEAKSDKVVTYPVDTDDGK